MDDNQNRDKTIDEKKLSDALEKTSLEKKEDGGGDTKTKAAHKEGEPSAEEENKEKTGKTADEKAEKEDKEEEEVFKQEQYAVNQNDHEQLWNDFFENNFDMYDFEDTYDRKNHK